jgi:hypothetical protein
VDVQPRPGSPPGLHPHGLLLPDHRQAGVLRGRGRKGQPGQGAGRVLPACGPPRSRRRRARPDRLHLRGRGLRHRAVGLRAGRPPERVRPVQRDAGPVRARHGGAEPAVRAAVRAGHAPALRRRRAGPGSAPLGRGREERGALRGDVGQHRARGRRAGRRAAVLRPPAPRRAPDARGAVRPPGVQAGAGARAPRHGRHLRERHHHADQGAGDRAQGAVRGGIHVPRRRGAGVAVRLPRAGAAPRRGDAALLHDRHARAPGPAAPAGLLRQRRDPHVRAGHGRGGGGQPGGLRGAARAGGDDPGRRLRAVARGLPRGRGRHEPAAERHLARAPPRHQLDGHVTARLRLRVGRAGVHGPGADVLQRVRVRDAGTREGRRRRAGAVAGAGEHAGVQEGARRRDGSSRRRAVESRYIPHVRPYACVVSVTAVRFIRVTVYHHQNYYRFIRYQKYVFHISTFGLE